LYLSFFEIAKHLKNFIESERPKSILFVGENCEGYMRFSKSLAFSVGEIDTSLAGLENLPDEKYHMVFAQINMDGFENEKVLNVISSLLNCADKVLFMVLPYLSKINLRKFHPTLFKDFDFTYTVFDTVYGKYQIYIFYPQKEATQKGYLNVRELPKAKTKRILKIGYLIPHQGLTGGLKSLLEQMRKMKRLGHEVYAIYVSDKEESAIPSWSDIDKERDISGEIIIKNLEEADYLDLDVLMIGFMTQIARDFKIKTVYWEQGYPILYGDYGRMIPSNDQYREYIKNPYTKIIYYLSVCDIVRDVLYARYRIWAPVLYNGIDVNFYHPKDDKEFSGTILLVGNPYQPFKNFDFAFRVLNKLYDKSKNFKVKWACQYQPQLPAHRFPLEYVVMPKQNELAKIYRESDIFFFTSLYESFPLPPIEAMASGLAVVSTDCGGIHTYAKNGENALLINQEDVDGAVGALFDLLEDGALRNNLSRRARERAMEFSWDIVARDLENYLLTICGGQYD